MREFIPHLDIMRVFNMAFRRAGLSVNYSEGFNPHALFFFCQPLPLGVMSKAEYFTVSTVEKAEEIMNKLNKTLPKGLKILKAKTVESDPNFAASCNRAEYVAEFFEDLPDFDIKNTILIKDKFLLTRIDKNGIEKTKDVRSLIFKLSQNNNKLKMCLGYGNENLRVDALIKQLFINYACHNMVKSITKTKVYDKNDVDFDKKYFGV